TPAPAGPDTAKMQAELEALSAAQKRLIIENAVIAEAARDTDAHGRLSDPADAVRMIDLSKITVADDGTVSGVAEAIKGLVEAKPYLVAATAKPGTPKISPSNPAGDSGTPTRPAWMVDYMSGQGPTFGRGGVRNNEE
ncbi:MAG: hypothetical protein JW910_22960, partial [Anaerolineae bacterium]|nr:hypothetical protein [Anaerolineae bacterium]